MWVRWIGEEHLVQIGYAGKIALVEPEKDDRLSLGFRDRLVTQSRIAGKGCLPRWQQIFLRGKESPVVIKEKIVHRADRAEGNYPLIRQHWAMQFTMSRQILDKKREEICGK